MKQPYITLSNGVQIPQVGLGTFKSTGEEAYISVLTALKNGYRHIDSARVYGNEKEVGRAVKDSQVPREEIFITTKIYIDQMGYDKTLKSFEESLQWLGMGYVDLLMIHWPQKDELNRETWKALEKIYSDKKARAIGVCNFKIHHLEHLFPYCTVKPMVNQFELHPWLQQVPTREFCASQGIAVTSYGPLIKGQAFQIPELQELAQKYHKSIVNIIVRWGIQNNLIMIPKSITPERIKENFDVFDFEISPEDMLRIRKLNRGTRVYSDPDNKDS